MTILEAITRADRIRPNELEPAVKLRWLSTLDGQVCAELLGAFEATGNRQQGAGNGGREATGNRQQATGDGGREATGNGGRGLPRQCAHWLAMTGSEADSAVGAVIDRPHTPAGFRGYDGETEIGTTELLIPFPYDELYLRYLLMRIDLENGELDRYNNEAAQFNRLWQSYAGQYCRTHRPVGVERLRF